MGYRREWTEIAIFDRASEYDRENTSVFRSWKSSDEGRTERLGSVDYWRRQALPIGESTRRPLPQQGGIPPVATTTSEPVIEEHRICGWSWIRQRHRDTACS